MHQGATKLKLKCTKHVKVSMPQHLSFYSFHMLSTLFVLPFVCCHFPLSLLPLFFWSFKFSNWHLLEEGWTSMTNEHLLRSRSTVSTQCFALLCGWSFCKSSTKYARITSWLAACIDSWQVTSVNHRYPLLTSTQMHVIILYDIIVILRNCKPAASWFSLFS